MVLGSESPDPIDPLLDAREELESGERYERSGALDRALVCYDRAEAAADDPSVLAEALRRKAVVLRLRCEWEEAIQVARRSGDVAREAGLLDCLAEALTAEAAVHQ